MNKKQREYFRKYMKTRRQDPEEREKNLKRVRERRRQLRKDGKLAGTCSICGNTVRELTRKNPPTCRTCYRNFG